jgi:YHS domain-containing protein
VFRTLLLVLLVFFMVRLVWRLLGGIVQGAMTAGPADAGGARRGPAAPGAVKMERDPVCGTYVVPGKALELARAGETLYFCSDKCRDAYVPSKR